MEHWHCVIRGEEYSSILQRLSQFHTTNQDANFIPSKRGSTLLLYSTSESLFAYEPSQCFVTLNKYMSSKKPPKKLSCSSFLKHTSVLLRLIQVAITYHGAQMESVGFYCIFCTYFRKTHLNGFKHGKMLRANYQIDQISQTV